MRQQSLPALILESYPKDNVKMSTSRSGSFINLPDIEKALIELSEKASYELSEKLESLEAVQTVETHAYSNRNSEDVMLLRNLIHRLEKLFRKFGNYVYLLESLVQPYHRCLELTWRLQGAIHSPHWKFLPQVDLREIPTTHDIADILPKESYRHPIDPRHDFKPIMVYGKEAFNENQYLLTEFNKLQASSYHPENNTSTFIQQEKFSALVTDTYPTIPKNSTKYRKFSENNDWCTKTTSYEDLALFARNTQPLSDPNNDGFFTNIYPGIAIGGTVDGSGPGYTSKLAANIALAVCHQESAALVSRLSNSSLGLQNPGQELTPDSALPKTADTSAIVFDWLQLVIAKAHQAIKSAQDAGSCTASFYVLLACTNEQASTNKSQYSDGYMLFFAAIGDVEIHVYSRDNDEWVSVCKEPGVFDKPRTDTSETPGGQKKIISNTSRHRWSPWR